MKYVIFNNRGTKYAIQISAIKRIIRTQQITRIPLSSPSTIGVTTIMGEVWPVHDIGYMMDGTYIDRKETDKILLLENKRMAFLIEDVDTIKEIEDKDIQKTDLDGVERYLAKIGDDIAVVLTEESLEEKAG